MSEGIRIEAQELRASAKGVEVLGDQQSSFTASPASQLMKQGGC